MSKPYYETEEYSEAENELDTYDDPVKLVMEYRVSEKQKDQQIAELKKQLADKQKEFDEFKRIGEKGHLNDLLEDKREENRLLIKGYEQLKQRFTDKEKEVQDLKEQLKSQPAEIVEKIKKEFQKHLFDWYEDGKNINNELYIDADWVWEVLDTFLKQYQK